MTDEWSLANTCENLTYLHPTPLRQKNGMDVLSRSLDT